MHALIDTPCPDWKVDQAIVWDWYDGPRSGFARLKFPSAEFQFELLAERPTEEGLDDRLFAVSALPAGTLETLLSVCSFAGEPVSPIWIPRWASHDRSVLERAEAAIAAAKDSAIATTLVIRSSGFETFQGCWDISSVPMDAEDWFAYLEI